ncbi:hypothetical protein DOTSEDRAFT_130749, partial [Dothistroma septosporum NZE10]
RPESRSVLEALARQNVAVWMLSGDNQKTACVVGAMVGTPEEPFIAGVPPHQIAAELHLRSKRKAVVAMVGDGVHDTPGLTVTDVGAAVGSASDAAVYSADFILVDQDLTTLLNLVSLSRVVFLRVNFDSAWALLYNLVALPNAAGVL